MHFPPETTTISLIVKMLAIIKKTPDRQNLLKKLSLLIKNGISYKLMNEKFFVILIKFLIFNLIIVFC
jgi:hypothetical protein